MHTLIPQDATRTSIPTLWFGDGPNKYFASLRVLVRTKATRHAASPPPEAILPFHSFPLILAHPCDPLSLPCLSPSPHPLTRDLPVWYPRVRGYESVRIVIPTEDNHAQAPIYNPLLLTPLSLDRRPQTHDSLC